MVSRTRPLLRDHSPCFLLTFSNNLIFFVRFYLYHLLSLIYFLRRQTMWNVFYILIIDWSGFSWQISVDWVGLPVWWSVCGRKGSPQSWVTGRCSASPPDLLWHHWSIQVMSSKVTPPTYLTPIRVRRPLWLCLGGLTSDGIYKRRRLCPNHSIDMTSFDLPYPSDPIHVAPFTWWQAGHLM